MRRQASSESQNLPLDFCSLALHARALLISISGALIHVLRSQAGPKRQAKLGLKKVWALHGPWNSSPFPVCAGWPHSQLLPIILSYTCVMSIVILNTDTSDPSNHSYPHPATHLTASLRDIPKYTGSWRLSCPVTYSSPLESPSRSPRRAGARMLKCLALGCHRSRIQVFIRGPQSAPPTFTSQNTDSEGALLSEAQLECTVWDSHGCC